jgi:hypothetical protein
MTYCLFVALLLAASSDDIVMGNREGTFVKLEEDGAVSVDEQHVSELKQHHSAATGSVATSIGSSGTFEPGKLALQPTAELSECTYDALVRAAETKPDVQVIRAASLATDIEHCSDELDRFLARHRWWTVVSEPFARFKGSDEQKPVVLRRLPAKSEKFMRDLTALQFLPVSECPKRTLALYEDCDGWGSLSNQHRMAFSVSVQESKSVFETYMKAPWEKLGRNFCPGVDNEWHCVFLPGTNCQVPSVVEEPCMSLVGYGVPKFYTEASADGVRITKQADGSDLGHDEIYRTQHVDINDLKLGPNKLTDVFHKVRPKFSTNGHFLWYAYRFNVRFRSLLKKEADEFVKAENVVEGRLAGTGSENCVAIHVRLGDRTRGMNMDQLRAWCKDHPNDTDVGCGYPEETWWAGLTLERYLKRAQEHFDELGGGNTVFVMTQDATWVDEQMKIYQNASKRYNIYRMAGGRDGNMDSPGLKYTRSVQTENTVIFWTSVMLAQRCNAFVGGWGSDVSKLVHRNMCYQHGDEIGVCPPATTMTVRL